MKTTLLFSALLILAAPLVGSAACPVGTTPGTYLTGKSFAFQINGIPSDPQNLGFFSSLSAAMGTFTAHPGGYLALTVTMHDSVNPNLQPVQLRTTSVSGRWIVNGDCTGGTLWFNLREQPYTSEFTVADGGATLILDTYAPNVYPAFTQPGYHMSGIARLNPPRACPVGLGNPLNLLKGFAYDFVYRGVIIIGQDGLPGIATGTFVASQPNPFSYSGDLTINNFVLTLEPPPDVTFQGNPFVANLPYIPNYALQGRYIIYPDCSGGELLFNIGNGYAKQFDFVFSKADFSEMFLLADNLELYPTAGTAVRK